MLFTKATLLLLTDFCFVLLCFCVFQCRVCLRPNRAEHSLKEDGDYWSLFFLLFLDHLMTSNLLPGVVLVNVLAKY